MEKEIENCLISLLNKTYNISISNPEQDYFAAGLDSFNFINFINDIETKYNIKFNNDDFQNRDFALVNGLAKIIKKRLYV